MSLVLIVGREETSQRQTDILRGTFKETTLASEGMFFDVWSVERGGAIRQPVFLVSTIDIALKMTRKNGRQKEDRLGGRRWSKGEQNSFFVYLFLFSWKLEVIHKHLMMKVR